MLGTKYSHVLKVSAWHHFSAVSRGDPVSSRSATKAGSATIQSFIPSNPNCLECFLGRYQRACSHLTTKLRSSCSVTTGLGVGSMLHFAKRGAAALPDTFDPDLLYRLEMALSIVHPSEGATTSLQLSK